MRPYRRRLRRRQALRHVSWRRCSITAPASSTRPASTPAADSASGRTRTLRNSARTASSSRRSWAFYSVSISFFHREGCLFCEAGGGRGPVGVAVRAQRGSLRRGLCNSPPTFLEDRQDYLQHLGGRRREIRHPPRSFAEQAHNRRAWLKTPPKGATSRRQGATAAQVRRGHRLPLRTRALVAGTTGMARPQALQRQRCQVASPTTGRLLVRLTSLPILALL